MTKSIAAASFDGFQVSDLPREKDDAHAFEKAALLRDNLVISTDRSEAKGAEKSAFAMCQWHIRSRFARWQKQIHFGRDDECFRCERTKIFGYKVTKVLGTRSRRFWPY